ncbi:MAG TPA: hypothetical protein VHC43_14145 [Mycobacteriales bacterium]|nr:hypothetical protein [Mycobacteriales bacterium]
MRALLGSVPSDLPQETSHISYLAGDVLVGDAVWEISRPLTTTLTAKVEIAGASTTLRLPASRRERGSPDTYVHWLLGQMKLPDVQVPEARSRADSPLIPVSVNDWLNYCLITGDEIDTMVFGHRESFRDTKRRYVFELNYGLYDSESASIQSQLRQIDLRLQAIANEAEVLRNLLAGTPFESRQDLEDQLVDLGRQQASMDSDDADMAATAHEEFNTGDLRDEVQKRQAQTADLRRQIQAVSDQIEDLGQLRDQLSAQAGRLTRAVVAEEQLLDIEFIVCPRCGSDVDADRGSDIACRLCLQDLHQADNKNALIGELDRVQAQADETVDVLTSRSEEHLALQLSLRRLEAELADLEAELDQRMRAYVSQQADRLAARAAERAQIREQMRRLRDYLSLWDKVGASGAVASSLMAQREDLVGALDRRASARLGAADNIEALRLRMQEYLAELHPPLLGDRQTVAINDRTYLPEISGRSFDELSSQGLKTIVNVAHSLAHHAVSIDRGLPLPGLLVLDGISSNLGQEGFDQDRVNDMYALIARVAETYRDSLQVVVVDNTPPSEFADRTVLTLSQDDRLIRPS